MRYEDAVQLILSSEQNLDFESSFVIASVCASLLHTKEGSSKARDLIIRVLDIYDKIDERTKPLWNDLVEVSGLHPYVDPNLLNGSSLLRREYFKSPFLDDIYLHDGQFEVSLALHTAKSVIVSAPTSFGKSLLIEEIVSSKKYSNIVIIQPTLALIDETRKKLQKYREHYNIIVSTGQKPGKGPNLFLFTGERVVEFKDFPPIDFFVLDEFYKLSMARDDERAAVLNLAVYRLLAMTRKFYMLGPNIQDISNEFKEKYQAEWYKTDFATVAVNLNNVIEGSKNKDEEQKRLFDLLDELDEPTLVYCSSPERANKFSAKYSYHREKLLSNSQQNHRLNSDLVEWINENVHNHWDLAGCLKSGIGVHHGALPRHLTSSMVDAFNRGNIKYLFCTATLIEGVNTSAKNVVLFDKKKGPKTIDYFDFKNIVGRSGRMKRHYIGNVYQFHPQPLKDDLFVDIPLVEQDKAPLELLVHVQPEDLTTKSKGTLDEFNKLDKPIRDVIRKNVGTPVEGQLSLINELENNYRVHYPFLNWSSVPSYAQLHHTLELGWRFLRKRGETGGGVRTPAQLATLALKYVQRRTLKELIKDQINSGYWLNAVPDYGQRVQEVVHGILQIKRHWFDYKLPKMLSVISEIQSLIYESKGYFAGNYSYFASLLENDLLPKDLTILLEYDIPVSAVDKIRRHIGRFSDEEELMVRIGLLNLDKLGLLEYEKQKIRALID